MQKVSYTIVAIMLYRLEDTLKTWDQLFRKAHYEDICIDRIAWTNHNASAQEMLTHAVAIDLCKSAHHIPDPRLRLRK